MNSTAPDMRSLPTYVTIWSKGKYTDATWQIERSHTIDYAKILIGTTKEGEEKEINGRTYAYFPHGVNPNHPNL